MIFQTLSAVALIALAFQTTPASAATSTKTPPKKKPAQVKPVQTKTIHTKDLHTSLKSHPGRTPVPVATDGDFGPSDYKIKMRPTNPKRQTASTHQPKLPTKLPARVTASASRANANDPISSFYRTLRASAAPSGPLLALGQALAVGDSFVVTSADFVSDTWTNSGAVNFYVQDSTQPLTLVGFDLGSNFAIFSAGIGSRMEHSLPLSRLRFEAPIAGEDYTSLGAGGLVGGARRVHPVQDLTFVRERFELPASVALSGGTAGTQFLFDKAGRWLGSVSLLDQRAGARRFDVTSANQAYEVIRQLEQRQQPLPPSVLPQQASSWQERWTNTFFESAKKNLALRSLDCQAEALQVDNQKVAGELARTRLVRCANTMPVSLTRDYSMGVELVTGEVSFTNDVKTYLATDLSTTTVFGDFASRRGPASINVMTGYECSKNDVVNGRGHHLHVRFCTSALKNMTGLHDTMISVISSDTGVKSTMHSMHLRGFEPKNAKRFMEWMIETETIQ